MKKILVIGSISIDNVTYTSVLPEPGTTVYGESFLSNIGGKGANQACAIHFLNGDVEFYGSVGDDDNGKRVQNFLKSVGLRANLKISKQNTGVASITIETQNAENRIVIVPGSNMDITKEDIDKIDFSKFDFLLLQLENPVDTICYAMKKAKEHGLTVILNPAPYHEVPSTAFKDIDFFIPNEHELEYFTPNIKGDFKERAEYLIKQGIKRVIVTLGEKGSLYVDEKQSFTVAPHKVNAIDTTGAGDSYCGAFLTALSEGKDVKEAMEFASKVSSIAVTRKGAIASLPLRSEIK